MNFLKPLFIAKKERETGLYLVQFYKLCYSSNNASLKKKVSTNMDGHLLSYDVRFPIISRLYNPKS